MSTEQGRTGRFAALFDRVVTLATGRSGSPDLSAALIRASERDAFEAPAGPTVPNVFALAFGEPPPVPAEKASLERQLADDLTEAAVQRGRRFVGPMRVTVAPGGRRVEVETAFEEGELPAWASLSRADDDTSIPIRSNRALVGRSKEGDVVINEHGVSRTHALIWREAGRIWIADLQSSNGTYVNGDPVYDVVEVRRSDLIAFGGAAYTFGVA